MQEGSQHNTKEDCWVLIDSKVYNLTSYSDDHPSGDDTVLSATSIDAAADFEDTSHSKSAKELVQDNCIGELDTSSSAIPELEIFSKKQPANYAKNLKDLSPKYWAIPVAVIGISVVAGFYRLRKK